MGDLTWNPEPRLILENIYNSLPRSYWNRWPDERWLAKVKFLQSAVSLEDLIVSLRCGERIKRINTVGAVPSGKSLYQKFIQHSASSNVEVRIGGRKPLLVLNNRSEILSFQQSPKLSCK